MHPTNALSFLSPQRWVYPGGEIGTRLAKGTWPNTGLYRIQNAEDLVAFIMANRGREEGPLKEVTIPYLPYARQDRVATGGDPVAIDVLADMLAASGVLHVHSLDVHSAQAFESFRRVGMVLHNISPVGYIRRFIEAAGISVPVGLVSPDKGALRKTFHYAAELRDIVEGVVVCNKQRDPITGKLSRFEVSSAHSIDNILACADGGEVPASANQPPSDTPLVIVDDICDGGGTFVGVADALRGTYGPRCLHLWTSHGIYSKGTDHLFQVFDTLGSTDSFRSATPYAGRRTTIPL